MRLRVGPTRRHLIRDDGSPFFYLADTAWELVHRLDREAVTEYLDARARQQFTAVQFVGLAELDGLDTPNPYGHKPLKANNPAKPNDDYFDHLEWTVARCADRGLLAAVLPTWGDKVYPKWSDRAAPDKSIFTPESAAVYATYLGKRLAKYPVLWVLGGDRPAETEAHRRIWRAMAAALKTVSPHLITYHPQGQHSSSHYFHAEPWLDLNMIQSGHAMRDLRTDLLVLRDLTLQPPKPTIEAEVNYEDHPVWWKPETHGWFDDYDVRKSAYRAVFAGAAGYTYGCHNVWQMYAPPHTPVGHARHTWRESLDLPGANQMRHLRALVESVPWAEMAPNPAFALAYHDATASQRPACLASPDHAHILLYCPEPKTLDLPNGAQHAYRTYRWRTVDCRTGSSSPWSNLTSSGVYFPTDNDPKDFVVHLTSKPSDTFTRYG